MADIVAYLWGDSRAYGEDLCLNVETMPQVLFESATLLVVAKPSGLIVHRDGRTVEASLSEWVGEHFPDCMGVGGVWTSPQGEAIPLHGVVHRLDRDTSGVIVIARTQEMFDYLKSEFKARRVEKIYRAVVYGHPEQNSGRIVAEIARSSEIPKRWYARPCADSDVRAAITEWCVLGRYNDNSEKAALLELSPKTGRTHQLRVHLASIGHAIVCDQLYAKDRPSLFGFSRLALHAWSISIEVEGRRRLFEAPPPPDFSFFS